MQEISCMTFIEKQANYSLLELLFVVISQRNVRTLSTAILTSSWLSIKLHTLCCTNNSIQWLNTGLTTGTMNYALFYASAFLKDELGHLQANPNHFLFPLQMLSGESFHTSSGFVHVISECGQSSSPPVFPSLCPSVCLILSFPILSPHSILPFCSVCFC